MKCYECKKPIDDAIGYEGYILCYPCYEVWNKADEKVVVHHDLLTTSLIRLREGRV